MVFYLSSTGHAATTWIANTFSLHPEVTTYHGTRTIPAKSVEDYEDISKLPSGYCPKVAKRLTDGLVKLERRDGNVYGAIHTMWRLVCKDPIENAGGRFGGIVRNPISQINSVMNAFTPRALSHNRVDVDYQAFYSFLDVVDLDQKYFEKLCLEKINYYTRSRRYVRRSLDKFFLQVENAYSRKLQGVIRGRDVKVLQDLIFMLMHSAMHRVNKDHTLFTTRLDPESVIVTEKITSDQDYLNRKFNHFTGKDFPPDIHVSELKRVRPHSNLSMSPDEIWEHWPDAFKKLFRYKFLETPLKDFYQRQGYWLPA